ncbi:retrovirus-related pol polyprotein from transposon TNT 1-94 [Tanacetum coccineum]
MKPTLKHLHIFGCTCYITRDGENLDKMKEKGGLCILVGYSTQSEGYRVYNKRTKLIIKSIHINFDELKEMSMTSDDNTSGLAPQQQILGSDALNMTIGIQDHNNEHLSSTLVPNVVPPSDKTNTSQQELDLLFNPMYEEYFTIGNPSVSKSFTLSGNLQQQHTQPTLNVQPILELTTPPINVNAEENNTDQAADVQFKAYEFINPFPPPRPDVAEYLTQY